MTIAITGTTGNIGTRLVRRLLSANADLTLLVRNPAKLDPYVRDRVKVQQGELHDADFVRRATEGASALFWLTPSDVRMENLSAWFESLGTTVAGAVAANGIAHVVNLSSIGAQKPDAGLVTGLGTVERHLNGTEASIIHLRPGFFMENILMQLDAIRHQGSLYIPGPPDVAVPQIATRDIADAAAPLLLERNWTGKTIHGLHGPVDLSFQEAAEILSEALGRPIRSVEITPDQARQALLAAGMGPAFADGYLAIYASLSQPGAVAEPRTPETTTPTSLLEWATDTLKPALDKGEGQG
jgi:uncharacterized protein YbjT (DUF2867 family)